MMKTLRIKANTVLDSTNKIYLDGEKKGNFSRFINHSCDPNSGLQPWYVPEHHQDILIRIGIFAQKKIVLGYKITKDYGPLFSNGMDGKTTTCMCNSKNYRKKTSVVRNDSKFPV